MIKYCASGKTTGGRYLHGTSRDWRREQDASTTATRGTSEVLSDITEDKGQLFPVALVSCRFCDLVRIMLPRDIHFQLYTSDFERCQIFI